MAVEIVPGVPEVDARTRRAVWNGLGSKSVREIAEETGLSPEQVFAVKRQLFEEVDVLTLEEQRMKLMVSLGEMSELAMQRARESSDPRNHAGLLNAATGAIEKSLKQVRALESSNSDAVAELNRLRVQELLRLIDVTIVAGVSEIAEDHGLDSDDLLEVFQRRLRLEAAALEAERA